MHGWFQRLFRSRESGQHEKEAPVTNKSTPSVNSISPPSVLPLCSLSSSSSHPPKTLQSQSALSSQLRWNRKYDVFVCHSTVDSDTEEALRLVSFLEASPCSLRCFLRQRDDCPGGAVSTELCQAVQNSHVWALFITPSFLQDEWCMYMMHQALAEAPMSNRIIPMVQNLPRSQYPRELKFYFYIELSGKPVQCYTRLKNTALKYLEDLAKNEMTLSSNTDTSSNGLCEEDSKQDDLASKHDTT